MSIEQPPNWGDTSPQQPSWGQGQTSPVPQPPANPPQQPGWGSPPAPPSMDEESRRQRLEQRIQQYLTQGYRIEVRTEYSASMVKGKRINHLLHLVLTLVTFGFWVVVWILLAIFGGEKRAYISE
jgi:hypothetical protein